jgi:hypothetical protein
MANLPSKQTPTAAARLLPAFFGPMDKVLLDMKKDPALVAQVQHCALSLREEMEQRNDGRAAIAIERLSGHYPRTDRDDTAFEFWAEDWLEDIRHLPPCVIEEACAEWRRSPERWMPTPGQLLEKAERIMGHRLAELRRAEALADADLDAVKEPRKPTDEERAEMQGKLRKLWEQLR